MQKYDSNKKSCLWEEKWWLRWEKKKRRNLFFQHDDSLHTESPTEGCCQFLNLLDLSWLLKRWPKPNDRTEVVSCFWVSVVIVHRKTERISRKRSFLSQKKRSLNLDLVWLVCGWVRWVTWNSVLPHTNPNSEWLVKVSK